MSMQSAFYIVQTKPDWYRLHVTKTHFCIGAGDSLEKLLKTVEEYVLKYKTEEEMFNTISELEYGRPNTKTLLTYIKDYNTSAKLFKDRVEKVVTEIERKVFESSSAFINTSFIGLFI